MTVKLEASLGETEGVAMERTFLRCFSNELQLNTDELQLNTDELKKSVTLPTSIYTDVLLKLNVVRNFEKHSLYSIPHQSNIQIKFLCGAIHAL